MAQHLNLLDARLLPRAVPLSAAQALAAMAAVALGSAAAAYGLQHAASGARPTPPAMPSPALAASPLADLAAMQAELLQLREFEAAQQRVGAALRNHVGTARIDYSDVFQALARQAGGPLWITGFAVSADGEAFELDGRMLDPAALPPYLRRLNQEPPFAGRPFAQLQLSTVDGADAGDPGAQVTAFALRSGGNAGPPPVSSTPTGGALGAAPSWGRSQPPAAPAGGRP